MVIERHYMDESIGRRGYSGMGALFSRRVK
jgi:hypothetical protein